MNYSNKLDNHIKPEYRYYNITTNIIYITKPGTATRKIFAILLSCIHTITITVVVHQRAMLA